MILTYEKQILTEDKRKTRSKHPQTDTAQPQSSEICRVSLVLVAPAPSTGRTRDILAGQHTLQS